MIILSFLYIKLFFLLNILPISIYSFDEYSLENSCSRSVSRKVRDYLNNKVYSQLPFSADKLPFECSLHPHYDLYNDQELHKKELIKSDWKCGYCNKHFKSEHYIDKHMYNKHSDKLLMNTTSSSCLASLCPVFGCHSSQNVNKNEVSFFSKKKKFGTNDGDVCTTIQVEKNKYKCERTLKSCFNDDQFTINGENLHDYFHNSICEKIHCNHGRLEVFYFFYFIIFIH
jgi:hypothetical protein